MNIPKELLEFLQDMRETIQCQGMKIHELELRIRELEKGAPREAEKKEQIDVKDLFSLDDSLQIVRADGKTQLVRTEAGMTALAVTKRPVKHITILNNQGENRPQFVYFGVVDAARVADGKTTMSDCYMINTSGKGKISGEQWQDYDEPMHSVILEAERFDITVESCSMSLMCDLGRDCCMFPKLPEDYRLVIGVFGQGAVELANVE